jgi:hypothetical protein
MRECNALCNTSGSLIFNVQRYGYYYCNSVGLAIGVRIAIAIVVVAVCGIIASILIWRRRRALMANNAILLQQQQQQPNQWVAPPAGYPTPPMGGYPNNGYPGYPNNGPQPFQPGYGGGYTGGAGAAKGYDVNPNGTPLQEPARSYNPEQPYPVSSFLQKRVPCVLIIWQTAYSPPVSTPAPAAPAPIPTTMNNEPPTYSGYNPPPPQATGAPNTNPYTYSPPDTHKV